MNIFLYIMRAPPAPIEEQPIGVGAGEAPGWGRKCTEGRMTEQGVWWISSRLAVTCCEESV